MHPEVSELLGRLPPETSNGPFRERFISNTPHKFGLKVTQNALEHVGTQMSGPTFGNRNPLNFRGFQRQMRQGGPTGGSHISGTSVIVTYEYT